MENLSALLSSGNRQIYLERSGLATRCRLACAAVAAGRSAVLVARDREEYAAARLFFIITQFSNQ